jgi:hypothetical protein
VECIGFSFNGSIGDAAFKSQDWPAEFVPVFVDRFLAELRILTPDLRYQLFVQLREAGATITKVKHFAPHHFASLTDYARDGELKEPVGVAACPSFIGKGTGSGLVRVTRTCSPPAGRAVRGLSPEERVRGLSPEERVRGLSPEEVLRALSLEGMSDEQAAQVRELLERKRSR